MNLYKRIFTGRKPVISMKGLRHVERDGYHAICWPPEAGMLISDLWRSFPELVVGKYLVNTSFDSGKLTISESESGRGWRMSGMLAHSPRILNTDEIPHDQFDEWLVFDRFTRIEEFKTMVNFTDFSPIDFGWDDKRERFWNQVIRLQPLHVIAENDGAYLVTRDGEMAGKILKA